MQKRKIGSLDVSVVGLGTNNFGGRLSADLTGAVLSGAVDAGVNYIDSADVYGGTIGETCIGEWLKTHQRDQIVLTTKFGLRFDDAHKGGGSPNYVRFSAEGSLRRLNTDYIDLYLLHQPDPQTPLSDTLAALDELIVAGKVREIGCSGFTAAQLAEATEVAAGGGPRFVNLQSEYSLLNRAAEREVLPECRRAGVGFVAYRPLAHGLLTGKYRRGQDLPEGSRLRNLPAERVGDTLKAHNFDVVEQLTRYAEERGETLLRLAMSFLLTRPEVSSVIAGAMTGEQIAINAKAADWQLTPAEVAAIEELTADDLIA